MRIATITNWAYGATVALTLVSVDSRQARLRDVAATRGQNLAA